MICDGCSSYLDAAVEREPPVEDAMFQAVWMQDLLRSNEPPQDADEPAMKETRAVYQKRLQILDDRIVQAQKILDNLKTVQQQVAVTVTKYDTVLHPMRRLPDDILCEIFLACINPDFWNTTAFEDVDCSAVLKIIPQICRKWRQLAIGFPRLWSYIAIDFDRDATKGSILSLGLQLQRSKGSPLTVWLAWGEDPEQDNPLLLNVMLSSERWKMLILAGGHPHFRFMGGIRGSLSSLESLYLECDEPSDVLEEDEEEEPIDCFEYAPRLRILRTNFYPSIFVLPWTQLSSWTSTSESWLPAASVLLLFGKMTNLESCDIEVSPPHGDEPDNYTGDDVTLPLLKLLCLSEQDEADVSQVTDHLILPEIKELQFSDNLKSPTKIASFIQRRCNPHLHALTVYDNVTLNGDALTTILRAATELRTVSLGVENCFTDAFVESLMLQPDSPHLGDYIEEMTLSGTLPCSTDVFLRMVESRFENSRLQTVHLEEEHDFSATELERIKKWAALGFEFRNGTDLVEQDEMLEADGGDLEG